MTQPGNFILRWARLKRQSDIEPVTDPSRNGSAIGPKETVLVLLEATATQPRIDAGADEPFDPSGLPSIEAITANTGVRGLLQSRVPAELTRAALRQVWTNLVKLQRGRMSRTRDGSILIYSQVSEGDCSCRIRSTT